LVEEHVCVVRGFVTNNTCMWCEDLSQRTRVCGARICHKKPVWSPIRGLVTKADTWPQHRVLSDCGQSSHQASRERISIQMLTFFWIFFKTMISNDKIYFIFQRIKKRNFYFGFIDILSAFFRFLSHFSYFYMLHNVFRTDDKMYFVWFIKEKTHISIF